MQDALERLEGEGADPADLARWREMAARFDLAGIAAELEEAP
ncbi:hypothetical protein [Mangrovicoccus ximenensis]|nr:hypothetical protein [Mangrovicoccus ximenensis]